MFNGLQLYFLFYVGSHVILKYLVYLLYFFLLQDQHFTYNSLQTCLNQ